MPTPPVALTIAGVDSAGGAGVLADLRTFAALGVHGTTAVAALTAQNTETIRRIELIDPDLVVAQVEAVLDDLDVLAVKTGFLGHADTVRAVADLAARLPRLVVDPVLVRSTGVRLFDRSVEDAYLEALIPRATVLTPNRVEAGILLGLAVETVADMESAAVELATLGPDLVVVKGGDATDEGDDAVDVIADRSGTVARRVLPRVATANDHGSGCTFAAATAAHLALGAPASSAVDMAKRFVHEALIGAADWRLGAGHGPLDQLGWEHHR